VIISTRFRDARRHSVPAGPRRRDERAVRHIHGEPSPTDGYRLTGREIRGPPCGSWRSQGSGRVRDNLATPRGSRCRIVFAPVGAQVQRRRSTAGPITTHRLRSSLQTTAATAFRRAVTAANVVGDLAAG